MAIEGLYAITPDVSQTDELLDKVEKVLRGGVALLQYRNKLASTKLLREQAEALLCLCRKHAVPLIVNDHWDLALEIGADGIHLGQEDLASQTVTKELVGYDKIVGVSCYNLVALAVQAQAMGASYVAFGAFYPSTTKPKAVKADVGLIQQAKQAGVTIPIVGIGGIRLTNAAAVIRSGCTAIAVSDDLFHAPDIEIRARQFQQLFANDV